MFENLDDPRPPAFGPDHRQSVVSTAMKRIRAHRRRRLTAVVSGGVACVALLVGFVSYEGHRLDGVDKVHVATRPSPTPGIETFLLVATDGDPSGTSPSADAVAVVRLDPAHGAASVLRIPRDLVLEGADGTGPTRVSALLRHRGPSALVDAVDTDLGIGVQHLVVIDPDGMAELIDLVGGVRVRTDAPVRDGWTNGAPAAGTGFSMPGGTCVTLDGARAVALARSRSLEVERNGTWERDGSGDLGRMTRQNDLAVALLGSFSRLDVTNPVTLDHLVDAFVAHVVVDASLDATSLVRLARTLHGLSPASVDVTDLPLETAHAGAASVLALGDGWSQVVAAFEAGESSQGREPVVDGSTGTPLPEGPVAVIAGC